MNVEEFEWKEQYGIGIEIIDKAHEDFFRIIRRLYMANQQKKNNYQWAGEEGIKFLKSYVVRHFEEEEKFMESIDYKNLAEHRAQHNHLREKIVPRIESHLKVEGYSGPAMDKFLRILRMWLNRHILVYDKAIGWAALNQEEVNDTSAA